MHRRSVFIVVIVLLLGACRAATDDGQGDRRAGFAGGGPVLLVGDSILVGADEIGRVRELLEERGWEPELDAAVGRSPRTAIQIVAARDRVPDDVVLVLGSNPSPTLGTFPAEIDEMIEKLRERGARRIVWIPPRHADPQRYAERVEALITAAETHEEMSAPDWGTVVDEYPWIIGGDGLHLSTQGYVLLAYYIGSALSVANDGAGPATIPDPDATPPAATYDRPPPQPSASSTPHQGPSPTQTASPSPSPTTSPSPSPSPSLVPTTPPTPTALPTGS